MAGQTQFLLDTNVLLAALIAPDSLPGDTQAQLCDPANAILFSAASLWEIAFNCSLGREGLNFRPALAPSRPVRQAARIAGASDTGLSAHHR